MVLDIPVHNETISNYCTKDNFSKIRIDFLLIISGKIHLPVGLKTWSSSNDPYQAQGTISGTMK
jgi:hypothetical protein